MSNCFNDFFVNIGNSVEEKIPRVEIPFSNFLKEENKTSFFIRPVDDNEVKTMIKNLSTSKSCGPNSIPTIILKENLQKSSVTAKTHY